MKRPGNGTVFAQNLENIETIEIIETIETIETIEIIETDLIRFLHFPTLRTTFHYALSTGTDDIFKGSV